jgi:hypothetical protein
LLQADLGLEQQLHYSEPLSKGAKSMAVSQILLEEEPMHSSKRYVLKHLRPAFCSKCSREYVIDADGRAGSEVDQVVEEAGALSFLQQSFVRVQTYF